ncbi:hypothetical protein [Actinopolymorpha rutila]|uniref:PAAR motif-containing protein n=1 Tax=Actinopolymorpha rutila TaxID=446787 RepID=A0A852ZP25_9ACTN|nr:hypothetical protein [Actinopolymorpha rutila]NYH90820.1 hypothetical protein [Actinopolymorpha rutila]
MGFLVQQGATVICGHGGQATPTAPNPRVLLGGTSSVTLSAPWTVAGCPLPPNAGGPCTTATWTTGTVRVLSGGQPLVVQGGSATCVPTGVPLTVVVAQLRVQAS